MGSVRDLRTDWCKQHPTYKCYTDCAQNIQDCSLASTKSCKAACFEALLSVVQVERALFATFLPMHFPSPSQASQDASPFAWPVMVH